MAISYIAQAESTSTYLTMPSGILADDLIVVLSGTYYGNGETLQTSGYTFLTTQSGPSGGTAMISAFYKIASGSESGTTLNGPTAGNSLAVVVLRGANITTPINTSSVVKAYHDWSTSHTFPSVATTSPSLVLWASCATGPASTRTTSFTNKIVDQSPNGSPSLFIAYQEQTSAGILAPESTINYLPSTHLSGAVMGIPVTPASATPPVVDTSPIQKVGAVASATNNVSLPSGIQKDDLIIIAGTTFSGNSTTLATTGYTLLGTQGGGGGEGQVTIWYKVASGSESGVNINGPAGNNLMSAVVMRGTDPYTPIDTANMAHLQQTWKTVHTFPSVTITSPSYVLWVDGSTGNDNSTKSNTFPAAQLISEYKSSLVASFMAGSFHDTAGTITAPSTINSVDATSDAMWSIPLMVKSTKPRVDIVLPTSAKYGKPITLTATATAAEPGIDIVSYAWTIAAPGDSSPAISTPNNSSSVYFKSSKGAFTGSIGAPAVYTINVTVTDSNGQTGSVQKTLSVKADKWVKQAAGPEPARHHTLINGVVYPNIAAPAAPNVTVSTGGMIGSLLVSWPKPNIGGAEIVGYEIWKGLSSGGTTLLTTIGSQNLSYVDSAVSTSGTTYYKVVAINAGGKSTSSTEVSATAINNAQPIIAGFVVEDF